MYWPLYQYDYEVFRDCQRLHPDTDIDRWITLWANNKGKDGWWFYDLQWTCKRNKQGRPNSFVEVSVYALGCRILGGGQVRNEAHSRGN